ncbi:MAG: hypothetical protein ABI889_01860 [Gemmatimonadota bacterium]
MAAGILRRQPLSSNVNASPPSSGDAIPILVPRLPAIEIRPRRATELVDASFQLLRRHYSQFVTVSALTMAPGVLLRIIMREQMSNPQMMAANPGPLVLVAFVAVLCVTVCDAVLTVAVSDSYLTGAVDLSRAFSAGMRKIISVLLASFFRGLLLGIVVAVISIGAVFVTILKSPIIFVLIVPLAIWAAIYILLRTFAIIPVVVLEDTGPNVAMRRTLHLSKSCAAHILFSLGLAFFLYFIFSGIISALGVTMLTPSTAGIIGAVLIIPIYPLLTVVSTMLYYDLRIRKEGFDLEIMSRELGTDATPIPAA